MKHYKENLEYMVEKGALWDFDIEGLDKLLPKLDGPRDQTVKKEGIMPVYGEPILSEEMDCDHDQIYTTSNQERCSKCYEIKTKTEKKELLCYSCKFYSTHSRDWCANIIGICKHFEKYEKKDSGGEKTEKGCDVSQRVSEPSTKSNISSDSKPPEPICFTCKNAGDGFCILTRKSSRILTSENGTCSGYEPREDDKELYELYLTDNDQYYFKKTTHPFTEFNNMVNLGIGEMKVKREDGYQWMYCSECILIDDCPNSNNKKMPKYWKIKEEKL